VYFVHFFDMVGGVVEDWFREAVGLPFNEMHIEFLVTGSVAGEEKFRARHKVALVSLDTFRSLPIPDDMRKRMQDYVTAA